VFDGDRRDSRIGQKRDEFAPLVVQAGAGFPHVAGDMGSVDRGPFGYLGELAVQSSHLIARGNAGLGDGEPRRLVDLDQPATRRDNAAPGKDPDVAIRQAVIRDTPFCRVNRVTGILRRI
jgi:hypothetical protein